MDSNQHHEVDGFNDAQIVDISTGFDGFDLPPRAERFGLIDLFLLLPSVALGLAFISRRTPSHDQIREEGSSLADDLGMLVDLRIWIPMAILGVILLLARKRHWLSPTGSPSARGGTPVSKRVNALAIQPDRNIEAIKVLREESGLGLAAAKAVVDSIRNKV